MHEVLHNAFLFTATILVCSNKQSVVTQVSSRLVITVIREGIMLPHLNEAKAGASLQVFSYIEGGYSSFKISNITINRFGAFKSLIVVR